MKVLVKTRRGTQFEIRVNPQCRIADVKMTIETIQRDVYPAGQQILVHHGRVLKDATTLEENGVVENSCIGLMRKEVKVTAQPQRIPRRVHNRQAANVAAHTPQGLPNMGTNASGANMIIEFEQYQRVIARVPANPQAMLGGQYPQLLGPPQANLHRPMNQLKRGRDGNIRGNLRRQCHRR